MSLDLIAASHGIRVPTRSLIPCQLHCTPRASRARPVYHPPKQRHVGENNSKNPIRSHDSENDTTTKCDQPDNHAIFEVRCDYRYKQYQQRQYRLTGKQDWYHPMWVEAGNLHRATDFFETACRVEVPQPFSQRLEKPLNVWSLFALITDSPVDACIYFASACFL